MEQSTDELRLRTGGGIITGVVVSRIPLIRIEDMTPEQCEQYARFPSNLTRGLLLTHGRLARAMPEVANAIRHSGLEAKIREGVILRVARLSGSAYERMQHLGEAKKAGWTDTEIAAIEEGDASALPAAFTALLPLVDECVAGTRASDAAFASARSALSARDIATVVLLVGHYMAVARFVATLDIELDPAPDAWTADH